MNLSIKNVPKSLVHRLRHRAEMHHRSMQGELMVILEEALAEKDPISPEALLDGARKLNIKSSSSVKLIREARNARGRS